MSAPTVRSFPRTMQQAFPRDPRHAYAVEGYRRERYESAVKDVMSEDARSKRMGSQPAMRLRSVV